MQIKISPLCVVFLQKSLFALFWSSCRILCVVFSLQIRKTAYRVMVFLKKKSKFCTFFFSSCTPFSFFYVSYFVSKSEKLLTVWWFFWKKNRNFALFFALFSHLSFTFFTFKKNNCNFMCRILSVNPKNCLPCDGFSEKKYLFLHYFFAFFFTFFAIFCIFF